MTEEEQKKERVSFCFLSADRKCTKDCEAYGRYGCVVLTALRDISNVLLRLDSQMKYTPHH